jgi:hypothetical protein
VHLNVDGLEIEMRKCVAFPLQRGRHGLTRVSHRDVQDRAPEVRPIALADLSSAGSYLHRDELRAPDFAGPNGNQMQPGGRTAMPP